MSRIRKNQVATPAPVVPEPTPAPVPEPTPEPEVPVTEPEVSTPSDEQFTSLRNSLNTLQKELAEKLKSIRAIEVGLRKLQTDCKKELKKKVKKVRAPGSSNHGFNALVGISKSLSEFLGVAEDSMMRRPEVTKMISEYAKANGLKDPANGSIFLPDAKLTALFGPATHGLRSNKEILGYDIFNLQTYLKDQGHFIKK